jgi:outer membrane cobalamin receptor
VGWEKPLSDRVTQRLETLYQHKRDLHLLSSISGGKYQVRNVDSADLLHLRHKLQAELDALALSSDLLFASTQVGATGSRLAYTPTFTHRLRAGWMQGRWNFGALLRTQTSVRTSSGGTLGGHGLWDLEGAYSLRTATLEIELSLTLENLTDRAIEWIEDYPSEGRRVVLGLVARL